MGSVRTDIELSNPREGMPAPIHVNSRVDADALLLCVPEEIRVPLKLKKLEKRKTTTVNLSVSPAHKSVAVHRDRRNFSHAWVK